MNRSAGSGLLELALCLALIGALSGILLSALHGAQGQARRLQLAALLANAKSAAAQAKASCMAGQSLGDVKGCHGEGAHLSMEQGVPIEIYRMAPRAWAKAPSGSLRQAAGFDSISGALAFEELSEGSARGLSVSLISAPGVCRLVYWEPPGDGAAPLFAVDASGC